MRVEDRQRVVLVAVLCGPLAIWGALAATVQFMLQRHPAADLSGWERAAYGVHSVWTFFLPVAILVVIFGSPVITTGIAAIAGVRVGGTGSYEEEWKSLWTWAAASVAAIVVGALLHRTPNELGLIAVSTPTLWFGVVSYSIAMGAAYRLVKMQQADGRLRVSPNWLFLVLFVTPCLAGLPALLVLVWLYLTGKPGPARTPGRRLTRP